MKVTFDSADLFKLHKIDESIIIKKDYSNFGFSNDGDFSISSIEEWRIFIEDLLTSVKKLSFVNQMLYNQKLKKSKEDMSKMEQFLLEADKKYSLNINSNLDLIRLEVIINIINSQYIMTVATNKSILSYEYLYNSQKVNYFSPLYYTTLILTNHIRMRNDAIFKDPNLNEYARKFMKCFESGSFFKEIKMNHYRQKVMKKICSQKDEDCFEELSVDVLLGVIERTEFLDNMFLSGSFMENFGTNGKNKVVNLIRYMEKFDEIVKSQNLIKNKLFGNNDYYVLDKRNGDIKVELINDHYTINKDISSYNIQKSCFFLVHKETEETIMFDAVSLTSGSEVFILYKNELINKLNREKELIQKQEAKINTILKSDFAV